MNGLLAPLLLLDQLVSIDRDLHSVYRSIRMKKALQ
jgi:hypothetical protein